MEPAMVVSIAQQAMALVLLLCMPPIVVATVVGLGLAFIQALTQLQEQTLSFALKLLAVIIVIALTSAWLGDELLEFGEALFAMIGTPGRR